MTDFSHDTLGICYWNGTLGPFDIGIVGSGSALKVLVDMIYNEAFREFLPDMRLVAFSNAGRRSDIKAYCETCSPVYETHEEMLANHPEINLIIEITGDNAVSSRIRRSLPPHVSLLDHREVVFLCGLHDMALVKGNYMNNLDHQRTLLQSIIDEIREDILLLDKSGNIVDLNRIVWQRAGSTRKELLGKPCWQALRLRDGADFCNRLDPACPYHKTLQSERKEEALVTRINEDGLLQYYRLYAYPIFDIRGNMSHVMVMHRDITERTHREKYQQQRDKFAIIGEMSTYLAHEIRNPLFAVGGFANALLKSPGLGEKEREKVRIIVDETMRLDKMLANMMRFARPSQTAHGPADALAICRDTAELMSVGYGKRGYRFEVTDEGSLPPVHGDPDAIKQCVVNLIKNSIEAMPAGGAVSLDLRLEGGEVALRVGDEGVGMNEQEQDKVFSPFYSTKENGIGLGLAMIKKIIEEYGGSVSLTSKPGKGTTVTLFLQPVLDVPDSIETEGEHS
ncbi:PAS domain S-box protein [Pseudodesulfovibrio cashew]|uniref:histidine kinase n=1 Tax=Pseudodesulfovibrio cashew TaxID=2678688 RepID=A0A6I6JGL3_9BACT|nr:ATP-binding protein [Pseudodesulfovibrio cashew]QGY40299.1 PAS domain S-box protein [Pseudodesulfovibrio cashew]